MELDLDVCSESEGTELETETEIDLCNGIAAAAEITQVLGCQIDLVLVRSGLVCNLVDDFHCFGIGDQPLNVVDRHGD